MEEDPICKECNENFYIDQGEVEFFEKKGFEPPKRCKPCRAKRKQEKENLTNNS